jgi:hypothetical protein
VPDAPASLAQDKSQDEMANDVVTDSPMQQDEGVTGAVNTDNAMSENLDYVTADEDEGTNKDDNTEDDITIMKIVSDSKKKVGKTGVGSRLGVRQEKVTEVVSEEPKSTKKKNVATVATKSPKKKKVTA